MLDDFSLIKKKSKEYENHLLNNKRFVLSTKVPSSTFFEIDNFLGKNTLGINQKLLNIKVGFNFSNNNYRNSNSSLKMIKSLPLFWISG